MLYFNSNIIDVRLCAIEFVHIYMMMPLDVTGCVRILYGYLVFGFILYLCLYDGHVGYLLHSCFKILSMNVSDVNGLNRYFNICFFGYDIYAIALDRVL